MNDVTNWELMLVVLAGGKIDNTKLHEFAKAHVGVVKSNEQHLIMTNKLWKSTSLADKFDELHYNGELA